MVQEVLIQMTAVQIQVVQIYAVQVFVVQEVLFQMIHVVPFYVVCWHHFHQNLRDYDGLEVESQNRIKYTFHEMVKVSR